MADKDAAQYRIDLSERSVTVRAETAKSKKKRVVPLNGPVTDALANWKNRSVVSFDGYVFINVETGKPFTTIKKAWAGLMCRAQIVDFTFHDLRHDFASRLVMAEVPLLRVRDLLGHSTIKLTERYAHLNPDGAREAVERIA